MPKLVGKRNMDFEQPLPPPLWPESRASRFEVSRAKPPQYLGQVHRIGHAWDMPRAESLRKPGSA